MADDRPLVRNAADPRQVRHAGRKEKEGRDRELDDLRAVLATLEGRRFLWRVIGYCKVFGEVFDDTTPGRTAFNAGVRNAGLFLINEITAADEKGLLLMMHENREQERRQATEAEAVRTNSSTEGGDDES